MIEGTQQRRFIFAQLLIGGFLTLMLTFASIAIADHETTPQLLRYVISPGFVLGLRYMTGRGFFDALGSFERIAFTVNIIYFGLITFLLLWKVNWPKLPRNPRHRFWMEP
ncbi:MAG: hypothetical protein WBV60_10020 [Terriglobales bacterium]